jgi:hypothetical protein
MVALAGYTSYFDARNTCAAFAVAWQGIEKQE